MRASDKVYAELREAIINWDLAPGAVLAEVELSQRLGVSRTPVREAVAKLVADGLAVTQPGRGSTVVADISLAAVEQMYRLRRVLDIETARLAATNAEAQPEIAAEFTRLADRFGTAADQLMSPEENAARYYRLVEELDQLLLQAADNDYLAAAVSNLRLHLQRVRKMAKDDPARLASSAREHRDISAAIAAGSAELAEATTVIHLHRALEHILAHAEKSELAVH